MSRRAIAWGLACALGLGACASAPPPKADAPVDAVEPLMQAQRKIENAISATKLMIERSRNADYLPDLYMRLAELYTEQARYAWLTQYEKRRQRGEENKSIDVPAARLLKNLAIGLYDRLLREFPRYAKGDEAMFLMAHEHRELGEFDTMRATYEKLIATYPKSPHRLEAYLILGDAAFDAGDLDRAEKNYNAVLAVAESHVHPLARYKLGWVRVNKEDCKGAVVLFEKILRDKNTPRGTKSLVATQKSLNIHREALVDLAYCYPDVYPDKPAAPFMRGLADTSSDYMAAMRRVSKRFFVKEMYAQAASALREVLGAAVAEENALDDARKLYDNIVKGKVYDQAAVDVERLGQVFEHRFYDHRLSVAKRNELADEFEVYARDIATRAQLIAREKKTASLHLLAANAYTNFLAYFPQSKARKEIETNRAEALVEAEQPLLAARAWERVAALETEAPARRQARLNSMASYQQALEKGALGRADKVLAWGGIRAQGLALVADSPADENMPKIKLGVAKSLYDGGDYGPAAELFFALARQYPATTEGMAGAHLALDSLRLADDFQRLATLGKRMLADARLGDEKYKDELREIIARTEQRQVTELTIASGGNQEEQLLSYAKRYKGSGLGEQALYNALLVARTNGDIDRFYGYGEEFIAQYPRSKLRVDVMTALASVASDRGDFPQAARYLHATYDADPKARDAVSRMLAAAAIDSILGDVRIVEDMKALREGKAPDNAIDELLLQTARSGNLTALQEMLADAALDGQVADFLRGYFAWQRGDKEEAARRLSVVASGSALDPANADAVGKSRFLMGEMVYEAFIAGGSGDFGNAIAEKTQLLQATDGAFAQAMQGAQPGWALAALGRVANAYLQYAIFLRGLKVPDELQPAEREQVQAAIAAKADDASKRAAELRQTCAKKAREHTVLSDMVRACLTDEAFPEKVSVLPPPITKRPGDPPGAAELRALLLKNPRNADNLVKLAELHLGTGDLGTTLLVLDRAESVDSRLGEIHNLRGVALERAGESDAAFGEFKKAVELDDKNTQARLNLAAEYAVYGYAAEAKRELAKAGGSFTVRGRPGEHPQLGALGKLESKGGLK